MSPPIERRLIELQGIVQGVGLRPFVFRLATRLQLRGRVRNDAQGVLIDVEGEERALGRFIAELSGAGAPPLADIHALHVAPAVPQAYGDFRIVASAPARAPVALVSPDIGTCAACLEDVLDPQNRRRHYPFTNCTNCGPRFTIVASVPYDRPRTTMARFPMCSDCQREYDDPADRRFHAQPIACGRCGPVLEWRGTQARGSAVRGDRAVAAALGALRGGAIVAIKGLGGYHLACDATEAAAVQRLRARKHRDGKPFAIMTPDVESARRLVRLSGAEAALLTSAARPIVLARKRLPCAVADAVAPGTNTLGLMLPYTPLHHLLLAAIDRPLVMTSGNRTDEPIAFRDDDARAALGAIADGFLVHDRPIHTRCDDSVMRVTAGPAAGPRFVRRSRGFAPRPLSLRQRWPVPVLAVGGHLKNTFCLAKESYAFLSHHVGDLENPAAYRALEEGIAHYCRLFDVAPVIVAHDRHPDYLSTRLAQTLEGERIAVQHHHAHVASCMAEHDISEPVIGVVFDGAGLGADGAIWGGEFLLAEGASYQRLAHLAYVPLPGGDAAAREPWRMGVAHLWAAYGTDMERVAPRFFDAIDPAALALLRQMLSRRVNAPPTSSAGRLFDAVAALLGVCVRSTYEAEGAMRLEAMVPTQSCGSYPFDIAEAGSGWEVNVAPLIRAIVTDIAAGRQPREIAGAFHQAVSDLVVETAARVARRSGVRCVALTGGVFQNSVLEERTAAGLVRRGYQVLVQRRVPCNDGGLSLGQALIAARSQPCA